MTMSDQEQKSSGIIAAASRHTGGMVGTTVVTGKKVAGFGAKAVWTLLRWPAKASPESAELKPDKCEAVARLQSELTTVRRELSATCAYAEKTQYQLGSKLAKLEAERETLQADLDKAQSEANEMLTQKEELKKQAESLTVQFESVQHESGKLASVRAAQENAPVGRTTELYSGPATSDQPGVSRVTQQQINSAVFRKPADKIIFAKAFSDIASRNTAVRASTARAIGRIEHELSVKVLAELILREPSSQVRQECVKALTSLNMKEGIPAVKRALTDFDASVRLAALWGMYRLAGPNCADAMVDMFSDTDQGVRRRAVTCVGWLGKQDLAVKMVPLLTDASVAVRICAVETMAKLRSPQVVRALIGCLGDPEQSFSKAVMAAIETITGKKMASQYPTDEKLLQRMIARWYEWWKDGHPE